MSFVERFRNSLAGRLTLWFVGPAILFILLMSVGLYVAVLQTLAWRDNQVLTKRAMTVRTLVLAANVDVDYLDHEVSEDLEGPRQLFIRIAGPPRIGTHETPGMPDRSFLSPGGAAVAAAEPRYGVAVVGERRFRTLELTVPLSAAGGGGEVLIQAAIDTSLDGTELALYEELLIGVALAALCACAVAGWYIVRYQLKPLDRLVAEVGRIDYSTLDHRVTAEGLPTELQQYANRFNQMLGRLQTAYQALQRYADDVAHELRTPLNRIQLEAELALREPRPAEAYREALESTLEECQHLSAIVQSLLFLARAENGQARLALEPMNVAERLETIRSFFEGSAAYAGISLRLTCDPGLTIDADPTLFQRAISNIVSNSLAHTPRGGAVSIEAHREATDVVVTVADTGEGIAPEHQPHVFDRFFRSDRARTTDKDRVGLGLAITKKILDLHRGSISLESNVGAGAKFSLHFPAAHIAKG